MKPTKTGQKTAGSTDSKKRSKKLKRRKMPVLVFNAKKESFHEDIDWPPDSPVAQVYDVKNTPASMVILNNKQQHKRLRGYENHQPSPPDPNRHSEVSKKNECRHSTCLDSRSPGFEPKPKIKPMWMNQNMRPPWTPVENNFTNPHRHRSCRISSDPATLSLEYSKRKKSAGVQRQDRKAAISMRDNAALVHPDLTDSNKRYMYFISKTYDTTNLKQLKQLQYRDILLRQQYLGYHSDEEYRKYMKYLEGPRKRQFGDRSPLFQSGHRSRAQSSVGSQSVKSHSEAYSEHDTESAPHSSRSSYNSNQTRTTSNSNSQARTARPKTAPPTKKQKQKSDDNSERKSPRRDFSPRSKKDATRERMRKFAKERKESKSPRPDEKKNDETKDDHSNHESRRSSHSSRKSSPNSRKSSPSSRKSSPASRKSSPASRKSSFSSSSDSSHSTKNNEQLENKQTETNKNHEEKQATEANTKENDSIHKDSNKIVELNKQDDDNSREKAKTSDEDNTEIKPPIDEPTKKQEIIITEKDRQIFDMEDKYGNKSEPTDEDNGNLMNNNKLKEEKQLSRSNSSSSVDSKNEKREEKIQTVDNKQEEKDTADIDNQEITDAPKIVISDPSNKDKSYNGSECEMSFEIGKKSKDDIDDDMKMNDKNSDVESTGGSSIILYIENEQHSKDSDTNSLASEILPDAAYYRGKYSPRPSESDADSVTNRGILSGENDVVKHPNDSNIEPPNDHTEQKSAEDTKSISSSIILPGPASYTGKYSPRVQSDASDNESYGAGATEIIKHSENFQPENSVQAELSDRKMPSREELKDGKLVLYFKKPSVDESQENITNSPVAAEEPAPEVTKDNTDKDSIIDDNAANSAGSNPNITTPQADAGNTENDSSLQQSVDDSEQSKNSEIKSSEEKHKDVENNLPATSVSPPISQGTEKDTKQGKVETIYKDSESDSSSDESSDSSSDESSDERSKDKNRDFKKTLRDDSESSDSSSDESSDESSKDKNGDFNKTLQDDVMKQLAAYEDVMNKSEESDSEQATITTNKESKQYENVKTENNDDNKSDNDEREYLPLNEELTLRNDNTVEIPKSDHQQARDNEQNVSDTKNVSNEQDNLPLNEEITLQNDDIVEIKGVLQGSSNNNEQIEKSESDDKDKPLTDTFPTEMFEKLPEQNEVVLDNQNTIDPSSKADENAILSDEAGENMPVPEEQKQQLKQEYKDGSKSSLSSNRSNELKKSSQREGIDRPKTRLGNRPNNNGDAPNQHHSHSSTSSMTSEEDMTALSASFYREGVDRPKSRGGRNLPTAENDKTGEDSGNDSPRLRHSLRHADLI